MKRMPCSAFFSVTTPDTGEGKVIVRCGLAGLRQRRHLLRREVPVAQARQAGLRQLLHAALRFGPGILHRLHALHGDRVLALRRHQLGAVDLEQRLALGHRLAGDVDMQAFDIPLELGRDREDAPLVRLDAARRAHGLAELRACVAASARTPSFWIFSVLMRIWFGDAGIACADSSSPS